MSCNIMFDEDNKCDEGNHLHGSCWSKESCQLDERNCIVEADKVAHTVVAGGDDIHKLNMCNCGNIYGSGDSYHSGQLYLFREIHGSCQSLDNEEICSNDNFGSKESHVKNDECSECKENSENSQPVVYNTEELDNCKTDDCLSESDCIIEYNHLECNVYCANGQADDDNRSHRSTYPTEFSDDDSVSYDNSDAENDDDHEDKEEEDDEDDNDDEDDDDDDDDGEPDDDTRSLYIIECNSEEFLETRPSTGFATIIRAFSVWAEMEQFEKPPPPAAKEVVQNLEKKTITEKDISIMNSFLPPGYQCPVCLGICEIGETLKLLPCTHAFHNDCILPWLDKTNTCPLCRHEMPTDNEDYELFKKIESGRQLRN